MKKVYVLLVSMCILLAGSYFVGKNMLGNEEDSEVFSLIESIKVPEGGGYEILSGFGEGGVKFRLYPQWRIHGSQQMF